MVEDLFVVVLDESCVNRVPFGMTELCKVDPNDAVVELGVMIRADAHDVAHIIAPFVFASQRLDVMRLRVRRAFGKNHRVLAILNLTLVLVHSLHPSRQFGVAKNAVCGRKNSVWRFREIGGIWVL